MRRRRWHRGPNCTGITEERTKRQSTILERWLEEHRLAERLAIAILAVGTFLKITGIRTVLDQLCPPCAHNPKRVKNALAEEYCRTANSHIFTSNGKKNIFLKIGFEIRKFMIAAALLKIEKGDF